MIQLLLETVGAPGAEVVYAWRSFKCYPTLSDLAGVTSCGCVALNSSRRLSAPKTLTG